MRAGRVAAALLMLLAASALAGGTLQGRLVTLNTLTYDDPAQPLLESRGQTVRVGDGIEFGMGPEGIQNGLDVVPVRIEILPARIEIGYETGTGSFWPAKFNGYVLRFAADCALFTAAHVDAAATTMAVTDADLRVTNNALYINVAGRAFGPDAHLAIDLAVSDCLLG
jgi:hypothetical protein